MRTCHLDYLQSIKASSALFVELFEENLERWFFGILGITRRWALTYLINASKPPNQQNPKQRPSNTQISYSVTCLPTPKVRPRRSSIRRRVKLLVQAAKKRTETLRKCFSTNRWTWEILGWLSSAAVLSVVVITLAKHENRPVSQWPLSITINALLSVFAEIGQLLLLFPLVNCISQLKWLWFTRSKRLLVDFEAFDEASRGPWGSFLVLLKARFAFVPLATTRLVCCLTNREQSLRVTWRFAYDRPPRISTTSPAGGDLSIAGCGFQRRYNNAGFFFLLCRRAERLSYVSASCNSSVHSLVGLRK